MFKKMPTSRPKNRFPEDFQTRNCRWAPFFLERHRHADEIYLCTSFFHSWPFDTPNGGHVFSPEKVTAMGPESKSRLEEPRPDANSTMKVICLHTLSNIYTPENERMTMEKPSIWRCIMMYLLLKMVIFQCYVCFRERISLRNMVKIPAIQAMFGHDDSSSLQPGRLKENPRVSANSWMKRSLGKLQMTNTFAESSSDGNDFNDMSVF